MKNMEIRQWSPDESEVRAIGDGMTFVGYAARFNSPSEWLGFTERIAPGAFTRTLKARNEVKAFLNHNTDVVLGSTRAGTLRLTQDDRGLLAEIDLPETTAGRDLAVSVRRGDVSGMSFGFSVPRGGDEWSDDGSERTLREIALAEVSPVTGFPAYKATTAAVRNLPILAMRAAVDVDALADAFDALQTGATLTEDQADLLQQVVDRARPEKVAAPEPDPVVDLSDVLAIKAALLAKAATL